MLLFSGATNYSLGIFAQINILLSPLILDKLYFSCKKDNSARKF